MVNNRSKTQKSRFSSSGFTVLEVISAIFILTVGVGGSLALIHQTVSGVSNLKSRLIASYLAQEGLEIVRNQRDQAWLEKEDWSNFPTGSCLEADYSSDTLVVCGAEGAQPLNIDSDGFYGYGPGEVETRFKRKISVEDAGSDQKKVVVEVNWEEKGQTYTFQVMEYLTNWFKGWGD